MVLPTARKLTLGMALAIVAACLLLEAGAACAQGASLPANEARAQEINKSVMCPVCPGESIDQSMHPRAKSMREVVDEKLEAGWTNDRIRAYFVERYGPSVLLEPPREGLNWLAWAGPPMVVVVGLAALIFALRAGVRSTRESGRTPLTSDLADAERACYFARVEAALAEDTPPVDASAPAQSESREGGLA